MSSVITVCRFSRTLTFARIVRADHAGTCRFCHAQKAWTDREASHFGLLLFSLVLSEQESATFLSAIAPDDRLSYWPSFLPSSASVREL